MSRNVAKAATSLPSRRELPETVLSSLSTAIVVVDRDGGIHYVNPAAEFFFAASSAYLTSRGLRDLLPGDSPLFSIVEQAVRDRVDVTDYGVSLESPRIGRHYVNLQVVPMADRSGLAVLSIHRRTLADKMAHQLSFKGAARSVTAMAGMLAHEIKNPLSGIRGAAQLLGQTANEDDLALTKLITEETTRINALVDRMDMFADDRPVDRAPVNIHRVLEHVRNVAKAGFARDVNFIESYDPSLPPVEGNRDLLIQIFLNLVKNAGEAVSPGHGEITIETGYQHGIRMAISGSDSTVHLPLLVAIKDNGPGIPDDIRPYLFEPFVSSKPKGSGLGLALVAKLVNDLGGVIDHDRRDGRTIFRVHLPVHLTEET